MLVAVLLLAAVSSAVQSPSDPVRETAKKFAAELWPGWDPGTSRAQDDSTAETPPELRIAAGVGHLFRAYEQKAWPKKYPDPQILLWGKYPDFSARNRVLLQVEANALRAALNEADPTQRLSRIGEFVGARAERRKEMNAEIARYESAEESTEGLTSYIEYRTLETAFPANTALRENRIAALSSLKDLPRDRERERFFLLGMAEGLILDRVRPGWKKEFESTDIMLDGLLARVAEPSPPLGEWGQGLIEEQRRLTKWEDEGSRRIGVMLAQPKSRKVVIEVGKARQKVQVRALNPNLMVQLTPNHTAFTLLQVDLDDMKLEFAGVAVVYEKQQDAFWCMLPEDVVDQALKDMGEKLTISGRGFKLSFENMEVSRRGGEIRIKSAVAPEKKGPLKPEFVKPKPKN